MSASSRPNVVVIVLDCVADDALRAALASPERVPCVRHLLGESVDFEHAVAPAPWTVPSHASIFTGLYPWSHGLYANGPRFQLRDASTMATILTKAGYATVSLSANPFISPETGLVTGFQTSLWGDWRELFLRACPQSWTIRRPNRPQHQSGAPRAHRAGRGSFDVVVEPALERYPLFWDVISRVIGHRFDMHDGGEYTVSPWIETELDRFLAVQSADQPVFAFVNLMDAHEPYLGLPMGRTGLPAHLDLLRARQDRASWLTGRWKPSPADVARLRALYQVSLDVLDLRLERLLGLLRSRGRYEETLLVLTSDHGQAFGSENLLFHQFGVSDAHVGVPLILRLPGGREGGTRSPAYVSLVDLLPTVASELELSGVETDGRDLHGLIHAQRGGPVFAVSDGFPGNTRRRVPAWRVDQLKTVVGVEFSDEGRRRWSAATVRGLTDRLRTTMPAPSYSTVVKDLPDATAAGPAMPAGGHPAPVDAGLERLRSWGYD